MFIAIVLEGRVIEYFINKLKNLLKIIRKFIHFPLSLNMRNRCDAIPEKSSKYTFNQKFTSFMRHKINSHLPNQGMESKLFHF